MTRTYKEVWHDAFYAAIDDGLDADQARLAANRAQEHHLEARIERAHDDWKERRALGVRA